MSRGRSVVELAIKGQETVEERMKKEDFSSTKCLENQITNRKQSIEKEKINWLNIKKIKICKNNPFQFFITTSYNQTDYTEVDLKKKRRRRTTFHKDLPLLWPNGKPISSKKLEDIKSFMHLISQQFQDFYEALVSADDLEDDIEGYNQNTLDFELEN
nr:unnamed protein product [Callosobruchus analis]